MVPQPPRDEDDFGLRVSSMEIEGLETVRRTVGLD